MLSFVCGIPKGDAHIIAKKRSSWSFQRYIVVTTKFINIQSGSWYRMVTGEVMGK